ncbi:toxin TcdB middle/N-terminal domain-containing protein [Myroides odoratus]|uniref:Uncharacterized conserved protein n=1 Tax=Myroides odoratus TaxID=256 RepID=A0A378RN62_MYROD|nr:toxin TcdB middle/N-terminal domain-containing protein [Myroides odoratus]QQU04946.1 hypothetical protein I6I89_06570 [Myroides odoratus]STZ27587.1 Uncharacterized conserved protein [Myroides odoratus]
MKVTIKNNFKLAACTDAVCRDRYVYLIARNPSGQIIKLSNIDSGDPMGYIKFRFKFDAAGNIVQKQRLNQNYQYENLGNTDSFTLTSRIGARYFFEYYTTEHKIGELLDAYQNSNAPTLIQVTSNPAPYTYMVGVDSTGKVKANVYTSEQTTAWGPMFRNWGQFAYKGADVGQPYEAIVGKNIHPFNSSSTTSTGVTVEDILGDRNMTLDQVEMQMDEIQGMAGNMTESFAMLLPNKQKDQWESHEHLYISRSKVSPYTRFLTDDIPDLRPPTVPVGNYGAAGINKYSYVKNKSTNKSLGFGLVSIGTTKTDGSSELLNEFMDVNGDGFPDIIGEKIQLTAKRGGLSSHIVNADFQTRTSIKGLGALAGGANVGVAGVPNVGEPYNSSLSVKVGNQGSASVGRSRFETANKATRFYVDINGDGLVDIVQADGTVLLNYGGTFRTSTSWSSVKVKESLTETKNKNAGGGFTGLSNLDISLGLSLTTSISKDEVAYIDLNGDGLPEKIEDGKYYINTGRGFEGTGYTVRGRQPQTSTDAGINGNATYCFYFPIPIIMSGPKFCVSGGGAGGRNISSEEGRYLDFDGDGFVDYVTSSRNESVTVYKSRIKRTNLLKKVTQTTGATISLDYDTKNPIDGEIIGTTYKMPYKKWALTKVSVYDGFEGDGVNTTQYAYEYYNGYKDRKERNFLGFGKTKAHLLHANGAPFRTDVTEYVLDGMRDSELYMPGTSSDLKQYLYKKGLPKKTYTLDKRRRLLTETTYDYKYYDSRRITGDINTTTTSNTEVSVFTEKLSILPLVTNMQTKQWIYQAETGTDALQYQMQQKFPLYDKMGNVKKYQDVDRGLTVDISYNYGIKTMPISHKVSLTNGNQQLRLTKASVILNGMKYADVSKYSTNTAFTTIKYEYDGLGNLIKKILPGGFTYQYDYGVYIHASGPGSEYPGDYFKILPIKITDPFGNVTRNIVNVFGQPVIVRDAYGQEIRYKYDAFNRLLQVKGPNEPDWTIRNTYLSNRKSITQHNLGGRDILYTSMITDGLGRIVQVKRQLENEPGYAPCGDYRTVVRLAVSGKNKYDEFGRVIENYLSEEELYCNTIPNGASLESILTTYYPTTDLAERRILTSYDDQDRVVDQLIFGTNAKTQNKYGFEGDLMTHTIILPEGNTTVNYFNKFGQTVKQKQVGNGEELMTQFKYDALGQVEDVKNAMNHYTSYSYDLLGQVIKKTASATGGTTFKYDDLGQLVNKKDANGLIVDYKYDFNRLVHISGLDITADFSYEQGGRLSKMKDNTGEHTFRYGKLGEVVEDTKMIVDQYGTSHYFKTKYKYDSWGRILEMVYPDREKIFYQYNHVGQLKSIRNQDNFYYLTNVKYNYFDQPYYIKYGNKVEMIQEFDMTERLRAAELGLLLLSEPEDRKVFARNVYGYDKNNNIISLYNNFSQHEQINVGGVYKKYYKYDDFNRLAFSEGKWDGLLESHNYSLSMKYNKDHAIASKIQKHEVYDKNSQQTYFTKNALDRNYKYTDSEKPQLTNIDGVSADGHGFSQKFQYLPNGNISKISSSGLLQEVYQYQNRDFKWDANNNITAIIDDGGRVVNRYLYDGKGDRVAKRLRGSNNLNINGGNVGNGMYGTDEVLYPSGNLVYTDEQYTKHYYANAKRIASRITESNAARKFEKKDFNTVNVSPHVSTRAVLSTSATRNATRGILDDIPDGNFGDITLGGSQTSAAICRNQIDFLLNSLYNTPEKAYCKQQLLTILEESKLYALRCVEPSVHPLQLCLRYEQIVIGTDYCLALEKINATGCVKFTEVVMNVKNYQK